MLRAKIIGPSLIQVPRGSTISLTCAVNLQASLILWWVANKRYDKLHTKLYFNLFTLPLCISKRYHNSTIVDYTRGGINLENEKTSEGITSRLLLTRANFRDTGNYSCIASQATGLMSTTLLPDSVSVQVL